MLYADGETAQSYWNSKVLGWLQMDVGRHHGDVVPFSSPSDANHLIAIKVIVSSSL
jgi:hypothetical protein